MERRLLLSSIVSGQTAFGSITVPGQQVQYTFNANPGDTFDISLGDANAGSALEPWLQVFDPAGTRVINAFTGQTNTSVDGIHTVPTTGAGTYTVIVGDNTATHTGAYALELAKAPATQAADSDGDGGIMNSSQTKAGNINRTGDIDVFTFNANPGDTFDISLGDASSASAFEPYLQVYDPSGTRVVNAFTGQTNTSVSGLHTVAAAEGGTFTVIIQDDVGNHTGAYDLELADAPAAQSADSDGDGGAIISGQTLAGSMNRAGDLDVFTFTANAGDTFDITLGDDSPASAFLPYLQVFNPTGTRVVNAFTGSSNTSVDGIYIVPASGGGTFTAVVQDDVGNHTGAYDLELIKAPGTQAVDSNGDGGAITSGQTKFGAVNRPGDEDVFTFSASYGQTFEVSLGDATPASGLHPYLQIYDPDGTRVINAFTGATNTSVSGTYFIPAGSSGVYTVIVQDDVATGTGAYGVELIVSNNVQATDFDSDGGAIGTGQTRFGAINRTGDIDQYTFAAAYGESIDISLGDANPASGFHPFLEVFAPDGTRVINAFTGLTNTSLSGFYTLPSSEAGIYTVIVQDDVASGTGAYNLELAVAPALQAADNDGDGGAIAIGQTRAGTINRTGDIDIFTFPASYGDAIQLQLADSDSSSGFHPYLQLIAPDGTRIVNAFTGLTNTSVSGAYTVPASQVGTYTVISQDSLGTGTGGYNLTLNVTPGWLSAGSGATYSYNDQTLTVTGGTLTIESDLSLSRPSLTIVASNSAVLNFLTTQSFGSLILNGTSSASVTASGDKVLHVGSLSLAAGASLDLADNDLVVENGNFATVQALVFQGYRQSADPAATGIISTTGQTTPNNPILALLSNALLGAADYPFGSGHTISANAIIGKYTYFGDTNLDGQVTADDYGALDANFGATSVNPGAASIVGDTNFDGAVTADDYGALDANFGAGSTNPLAPVRDVSGPNPLPLQNQLDLLE